MEWIVIGIAVVALVGVAAFVLGKRQASERGSELKLQSGELPPISGLGESEPVEADVPTHIILETDTGQEALSMSLVVADSVDRPSGALKKYEAKNFARVLEPVMQAAPSLITAGMANSKQLMEVVINGPLVAASDGNGLRAMTMGAKGVKEHARLFEAKNLQNVANAAAIWQIASVAVAQKHLADISATLKRVEERVAGIQAILEEERAALIEGALNYVGSARVAVERGEFLERTRDKLEDFEVDLERAGLALMKQIRRECEGGLDSDTFGCEGEYESALKKHRALAARAQELAACAQVRLANWYLCSLYPDKSKLLDVRIAQIKRFSDEIQELMSHLADTVERDCRMIDAKFTSDETIAERRGHVRREAGVGASQLGSGAGECSSVLGGVDAISRDRDVPTRLLIEIERGQPSAIYMTHEKPLLAPIASRKKVQANIPAPVI